MKTVTKSTIPKPATASGTKPALAAKKTTPTVKRPGSAKPSVSAEKMLLGTGSTAKQLSQVASTKEVDTGIHMTQILNYYRQRVEAFEKDRMQWYEKLQ
jgi:hypothetical protein